MTTRSQTWPLSFRGEDSSSAQRLAFSFLLTLAAFALFLVGFAAAYAGFHAGKVLPGVDVAGVSLAGLDRFQAEARLREALPNISTGQLTVRFGDVERQFGYAEFGRDYDFGLMAEQALSVGRGGDLLGQLQDQLHLLFNGVSVQPSLTWDSQQLAAQVTAAAEAASVEPVDALVERVQDGYAVVPAAVGRAVDLSEAVRLAHAAVAELDVSQAAIAFTPQTIEPAISTRAAQEAVGLFELVSAGPLTVSGEGVRATISAGEIRGWTRLEEQSPGSWSVVIERGPAVQFAGEMALEIDQPAQDAGFAFAEGAVTAVDVEVGRIVDVEASADVIMGALKARTQGDGPPQVNLAMMVVEPDFTLEEALAVASRMERLSRWRTNYSPGALNFRGANIRIPTEKIDGLVLEPGDTFDFWDVVGYPSEEEGYGPGAAIIRGRTVPDGALAGGICSCSTTIFNAALRAGLEMGDRRNHYYYINRYPVGLDATVWISDAGQRQTVSFTNDMEHPILVRGINRRSAVIFEIWGVSDGRTVELSRPTITNRQQAVEQERVSESLRPGQSRRVEWPANGFNSSVTRIVHDATGNVLHEDIFTSRYAVINGLTLVGPQPSPPPPEEEPPPPEEEPPPPEEEPPPPEEP